jgi:hypothetical protein
MKRGAHHTPEVRERIRQALRKRWQEDSVFRARQLANLRAIAVEGTKASVAARRFLPPKGTPGWLHYEKIRRRNGTAAARAMLAETFAQRASL